MSARVWQRFNHIGPHAGGPGVAFFSKPGCHDIIEEHALAMSVAACGHQKELHSVHKENAALSLVKRYRWIQSWPQRGQIGSAFMPVTLLPPQALKVL